MKTSFRSLVLAGVITFAVAVPLRTEDLKPLKKLTADDVIEQWKPGPELAKSYHHLGASPKEDAGVAAYAFRTDAPLEALWNHYAERCGAKERYEARTMVNATGNSEKGRYVLANLPPAETDRNRVSTFLLKTGRSTVSVTLQHHPDAKTITGSIAAVVP